MPRGVNKVIIIGHLGADPELRALPSGSSVANLRIATTESWKDKQSGEFKEQTEWHSVSLFGRTAEVAGEYLVKGSQVYIEGRLQTRKWQDKQGNDRYTTSIVGQDMQMLGSPRGEGGGQQRQESRPAESNAGTGGRQESRPADDDFSDDIPF